MFRMRFAVWIELAKQHFRILELHSFILILKMYVDLLKQAFREYNRNCMLQILRVKDNAVVKHPIPKLNKNYQIWPKQSAPKHQITVILRKRASV